MQYGISVKHGRRAFRSSNWRLSASTDAAAASASRRAPSAAASAACWAASAASRWPRVCSSAASSSQAYSCQHHGQSVERQSLGAADIHGESGLGDHTVNRCFQPHYPEVADGSDMSGVRIASVWRTCCPSGGSQKTCTAGSRKASEATNSGNSLRLRSDIAGCSGGTG